MHFQVINHLFLCMVVWNTQDLDLVRNKVGPAILNLLPSVGFPVFTDEELLKVPPK